MLIKFLSLEHFKSFRSTGVRRYDEISTIYTSFNQSKDSRPVECDVIGGKNYRWSKFRLIGVHRYYERN